jgi:transposase
MRSVMKRADRNMITDVVDALQARARRRRWTDNIKVQIVAESYAPRAVVSEVARRHAISPQLLSAWRKAARDGLLKLSDGTDPVARRSSETAVIQDRSSSGGPACRVLGGPRPRHELVQTGGWPEIDQLGEDVGEIGLRFDAAELTSLCRVLNYAECGHYWPAGERHVGQAVRHSSDRRGVVQRTQH